MTKDDLISRQAAISTATTVCEWCDTGDIIDYRDMMVESLKVLPSAQRWIPCSERLPKEGKEVLISTEGGSLYIGVLELRDDYFAYWYESQEYMTIKGSAWMPLPEPYKVERNEE